MLIDKAIKAVPAVRYALAVAAIAAVVAIALGFKLNPQVAVFGSIIVIAIMFVLLLFAKAASSENNSALRLPARILVWFYTILMMVVTLMFVSSYFAHWPISFEKPPEHDNVRPQSKIPVRSDSGKEKPPAVTPPGVDSTPSRVPKTITGAAASVPHSDKSTHRSTPSSKIKIGGDVSQKSQGDCSPNIIGSGNTTNCAPAIKITASTQSQSETGSAEMPWKTTFTIISNVLVQTGDLVLNCDGPALRAGISRINPSNFSSGSNGPAPNDPSTVIYQLGPEMLDAGKIVTIAVFSNAPIYVTSGSIGAQSIVFKHLE